MSSNEEPPVAPERGVVPPRVLPVRPPDLRPREAGSTVGAGDGGRPPGPGVSDLSGGTPGLGRAARPVRGLRRIRACRRCWVRSCAGRAGTSGATRSSPRGCRALSSAVERCPYKAEVGGSNPSAPTRLVSKAFVADTFGLDPNGFPPGFTGCVIPCSRSSPPPIRVRGVEDGRRSSDRRTGRRLPHRQRPLSGEAA